MAVIQILTWCDRWWECSHWTQIAYDEDGDPMDWCGHTHASFQLAVECNWRPDSPDWTIVIERDYDVDNERPCDPHGLHRAECERCLAFVCIHERYQDECERCISQSRKEESDAEKEPEAG